MLLISDIRVALRQFVRKPALALAVVAILALGIGANIGVFTLAWNLLYRPLPFGNADRLVRILPGQGRHRAGAGKLARAGDGPAAGEGPACPSGTSGTRGEALAGQPARGDPAHAGFSRVRGSKGRSPSATLKRLS